MPNISDFYNLIDSSSFGVFTDSGFEDTLTMPGLERIKGREGDGFYLQLRLRNPTQNIKQLNSFLVTEIIIPKKIRIGKILEHGWLQCSEVTYKNLSESSKINKIFLQRDQNPSSYIPEYGYIAGSIVSEWFTSVEMNGGMLFVGALTTKDQFTSIYLKDTNEGVVLRVACQLDGIEIKPGMSLVSEKVYFGFGEEGKVKEDFSKCLAKNMNIKSVKPRAKGMCNSYYWNGNKIDELIINNELDAIESLPGRLDLDYFQLDAGYTDFFGDWTDYKKRFPNGFEPVIKRINGLGYKPGIWLSPFAINPATKLHQHHPSWLLRGDHKSHFEGRFTSPFDTLMDVLDLEVLDPTKEEVKNYLSGVFGHFRDLGFKLFKIDFMYPLCLSKKYSKPVTRARALYDGVKHIKDVLGDECSLLTGISQISPIAGLADYVRTGIDTMNPFVCGLPGLNKMVNEFMLEKGIEETKARLFLNGKVWRGDPDCLVFRKDTGLGEKIIKEHKELALKNDLSLWIGDSIAKMDAKTQKDLVQFFRQ